MQSWHAFHDRTRGSRLAGFEGLSGFDEYLLGRRARIPTHPRREALMLLYVTRGALAYAGPLGASGVIAAGEFGCVSLDGRSRCVLTNASSTEDAHLFELALEPTRRVRAPRCEHRRFSVAHRRRSLCIIASPDGLRGSLTLREDAFFYSVLLRAGQPLAHELPAGWSAWLKVVDGEVRVGDVLLHTGDSAALTAERVVSVTAVRDSELLILDLRPKKRRAQG